MNNCVFKTVTFANKTLIISHFLCQSSSHYVIKSSTKNVSNIQKRSRHLYKSFRSHFWCVKVLLPRRKNVELHDWQAELQSSDLLFSAHRNRGGKSWSVIFRPHKWGKKIMICVAFFFIFRPHKWGRKIMMCCVFFLQILPNLHFFYSI